MKILHILSDGQTDLSKKIIEVQSGSHDVKVIDLSKKDTPYDAIIDEVFASDRVVTW